MSSPWLTLCLCQGRLCLRQPESHLHGAVQCDGRGQFGARRLRAARLHIEGAQAQVAVRLQGTHAQLLSQGEGLAVVGFGRLALRRFAPRRNVAEEAQGIRLVAAFLVLTGERQRALGEGVCLLQAASQQLRLPQGETTERLEVYAFRRSRSVPSPA